MLQLILYVGILCLAGYKSKVGFKTEPKQWLSKNQTDQMKGICALLVIVHHISSEGSATGIFHQFWFLAVLSGYLLVGYFFFVSGYGIAYSAYQLGENSTKHKLLKRYITVLIPYLVITIVYLLYYKLAGQNIGLKEMGSAIGAGEPLVRYSWYSIAIILLYTLYSISLLIKKKTISVISFFVMILGYVVLFVNMGFSEYWYNAVLAMLMGVLLAAYKSQIYSWLQKNRICKFIIFFVIFVMTCVLQIKFGNALYEVNKWGFWLVKELCLVAFLMMLLYVDLYITIGNRVLKKLSDISYEMYLTHGFVMLLVSEVIQLEANSVLYSILVIGFTIILSYIEHHINRYLISLVQKLVK